LADQEWKKIKSGGEKLCDMKRMVKGGKKGEKRKKGSARRTREERWESGEPRVGLNKSRKKNKKNGQKKGGTRRKKTSYPR